jgi:hypothetical protein
MLSTAHGARARRGNGSAPPKGRNGAKAPTGDRPAASAGRVPERVD